LQGNDGMSFLQGRFPPQMSSLPSARPMIYSAR
jgi:hypothetical protein